MRIKPVEDKIPYQFFWDLGPDKRVHVARLKTTNQQELAMSNPHHLGYYALRFIHHGKGVIYIDHVREEIEENFVMLATPDQVSWIDVPADGHIEVSVIAFNEFFIDDMGLPPDIQSLVMGELSHVHRKLDESELELFHKYMTIIFHEFYEPS